MIVLVTNDDGIDSPGLAALAEAARELGRVVVVAPEREMSGCSHALSLHRPLRIREIEPNRFAVDGTPADCVIAAVNGLLQGDRPGLVLSGINRGGNLGEDVIYSGTVAAAEEGALKDIPSLAVSVDARSDLIFEPAAAHAVRFARRLLSARHWDGTYFNMNLPNLPEERLQGVRFTRLGRRIYCDALQQQFDSNGDPYYLFGAEECGMQRIAGSDMEAVSAGFVSITPLRVERTDGQVLALAESANEESE